jgi:LAGLIDADG DNA endonuclease family protein
MTNLNNNNTNNNNNNNKLTRKQKLNLILSQEQIEIINGCMLGDLHAERINLNRNTRLQFKYSSIYKEYIFYLYNIFKNFTGSSPLNLSYFDDRENKQKTYNSIKFQTFSLPCFNLFRETFYNSNGIKIIPSNIQDLLTARSLAF